MKYRMLTISSNPNNILEVESYLKKLDFDFAFHSEKYANIECCGGRGVYIMKALSDDITFEDEGRTVEMYFDLNDGMV